MSNPVPIQSEGNPFYPLPHDYEELSEEGCRLARVNASRLWKLPNQTPLEKSATYVASLNFFDQYYLYPDHDADFDPMFYDMDPLPTPDMHWDIARQWATQRLCIGIAPRGAAKSKLVQKSVVLEIITCPMTSVVYATSTLDNTKMTGQVVKDQVVNNSRINDDWMPEFPGHRIVPRRGEAPFGTTHLQIRNGSWIRCISADSRQRGMRPKLYVLDDPEFDPKAATSMQIIRDYMSTLLFKMVLPMVMRPDARVRWLATFVSKRHYAWHAMDVDEQGLAKETVFNNWDRIKIDVEHTDADGVKHSCWPEMWPPTTAVRKKLAETDPHYNGVLSLEEVEGLIGKANYLAEYRAQPGEGDEVFFPNLSEEKHNYQIRGEDLYLETEPWRSESRIVYDTVSKTGDALHVDMALSEFCKTNRTFITVDTSFSAGADSDSKVCTCMAVTPENDLIVLDIWSKQAQPSALIEATMLMANKWRCPSLHIEGIKEGILIYNDLLSIVSTKASDMVGDVTHLPQVRKFNPGMVAKTAKISTLHRRFEHGKIKLPLRRRHEHPWRNLCSQIEEFNPDAPDGGLQHDDELDTVSMSMFVIRGRLNTPQAELVDSRSVLEKLKDGELQDSLGRPLALGVDWTKVSAQDVFDILDKSEQTADGRTRV